MGIYFIINNLVQRAYKAIDSLGIQRTHAAMFGTLRTGRVNGMAIAVPNSSTRIILLERGLLGFANLMCKAIAMAIPLEGMDGQTMRFDLKADRLASYLESQTKPVERFAEALCAYVVAGNPHLAPQYNPSPDLVPLSTIFRQSLELFVIGHELGHVMRGHLDKEPVRSALATGVQAQEISLEWQQEFEADLFGAMVVIRAQMQNGLDLPMSYVGSDLFFGCIDVVEKAVSLLARGNPSLLHATTHPPTPLRRKVIRAWLEENVGEEDAERAEAALELANAVDSIIQTFWARIEPAFVLMHRDGMRPAPLWSGLAAGTA